MQTIIYDDEIHTLNLIFAEYPKGTLSVLCPICKEELIVVLTAEDVTEHKLGPGVYCRRSHIRSLFNLR
jgi:hypothetical protein